MNIGVKTALKIVIPYLVVSLVWHYCSDLILAGIRDHELANRFAMTKRFSFLIITAVLLFILIKRYFTIIEKENDIRKKQECRYHAMIANSNDIITLSNKDGMIIYISENVSKLLGYSPQDIINTNYLNLVHPHDIEYVRATREKVSRTPGKTATFEMRLRNNKGEYIWVESSLTNKYDDEQLNAFVGNTRVITDRKNAQQAIKETEDLFAATFEQAAVGLSIKTMDGKWLKVNKRLSEMTGYTIDELMYYEFQDITHIDDIYEDSKKYFDLLAGKIDFYRITKRIIKKDKNVIWVIKTVSLVKDESGIPIYILTSIQDITEKVNTEQELLYRNKELDTFIYRSSHDLRGPIATLLGLSVVANTEVKDEKALEYFGCVATVASKMDKLLGDLMAVARIRQNKLKISNINTSEIINEVIQKYAEPNLKYSCAIEVDSNPAVIFDTDPTLVRIILENLLENAVKFRKPNADLHQVFLRAYCNDHNMRFTIRDTGIGISNENQEKMFDLYAKGKHLYPGNGVGLYVVKAAVDKLNGKISVTSKENEGTEITVFIPCCCDSDAI